MAVSIKKCYEGPDQRAIAGTDPDRRHHGVRRAGSRMGPRRLFGWGAPCKRLADQPVLIESVFDLKCNKFQLPIEVLSS